MQKRNGWLESLTLTLTGGLLVLVSLFTVQESLAKGNMPGKPGNNIAAIGEAARGQDYFMGIAHFQNGGPPCMGCHNIGSDGLLGGGALGPDLTNVSSRYNDADLTQALKNMPWPVMQPIFSEHPLTPREQDDLRAFLEASRGQPVANKEPLIFGISLLGLCAAAGLLGWIYRGRLKSVRRTMVDQALSTNRE